MSGIFGLAFGTHVLITGVEPDPVDPALLRVYVGPRYNWHYVLIEDADDQQRMLSAWGSLSAHVTMPIPPEGSVYVDEAHAKARAEAS